MNIAKMETLPHRWTDAQTTDLGLETNAAVRSDPANCAAWENECSNLAFALAFGFCPAHAFSERSWPPP